MNEFKPYYLPENNIEPVSNTSDDRPVKTSDVQTMLKNAFNFMDTDTLVLRGSIQSANFVPGTNGWQLNGDGTTSGVRTQVAFGQTTFSSTTTTTCTPGFLANVVFIFAQGANPNNGASQTSIGIGNASTNNCTYTTSDNGAGSASANDSSNAWNIGYGANTTSSQSGVVNNFTDTTFDLANTFTNGGNTPTANITWIALS